jgi:hypothetical protein
MTAPQQGTALQADNSTPCPAIGGNTVQPDQNGGGGGGALPVQPTLADMKDIDSCHKMGGYWYDNKCNATGITCSNEFKSDTSKEICVAKVVTDWRNLADCRSHGGYWYDPADVTQTDATGFAALKPTCHEARTTACPASGDLNYGRDDNNSLFSASISNNFIYNSFDDLAELYTTLRCFSQARYLSLNIGTFTSVDPYLMPSLEELSIGDAPVTDLYLARNPLLARLELRKLNLTKLDLSGVYSASDLSLFELGSVDLTKIDFSKFTALTYLLLGGANLSGLDQSKLPATLTYLDLSSAEITALNLSHLTGLQRLAVVDNKLTAVDLRSFSTLEEFRAWGNPNLSSINVTGLTNLETLSVYSCALSSVDVSTNPKLTWLEVDSNSIWNVPRGLHQQNNWSVVSERHRDRAAQMGWRNRNTTGLG